MCIRDSLYPLFYASSRVRCSLSPPFVSGVPYRLLSCPLSPIAASRVRCPLPSPPLGSAFLYHGLSCGSNPGIWNDSGSSEPPLRAGQAGCFGDSTTPSGSRLCWPMLSVRRMFSPPRFSPLIVSPLLAPAHTFLETGAHHDPDQTPKQHDRPTYLSGVPTTEKHVSWGSGGTLILPTRRRQDRHTPG